MHVPKLCFCKMTRWWLKTLKDVIIQIRIIEYIVVFERN